MTRDEYKLICEELDIALYDGGLVATPEQLTVKAQLLQNYFNKAKHLSRVGGLSPELIIQINNLVIDICFPDEGIGRICWWSDLPSDSSPRLIDLKAAQLGSISLPLAAVAAKVEEIINTPVNTL